MSYCASPWLRRHRNNFITCLSRTLLFVCQIHLQKKLSRGETCAVTYLHSYVCFQWSRPFQAWSRLVSGTQTVPPKILHFPIVAECCPTGSGQHRPRGCARPRRRPTGRPHVHVALARCCQSGLRVHRWQWGCCRSAPPAHRCRWTARYGGHTVWGSGPFRACRRGCLHRFFDRVFLRWGC